MPQPNYYRGDNKSSLELYLDSYGKDIPSSWGDYVAGGMFADLCVFCGKTHNDHEVFRLDPILDEKREVKVFCCNECSQKIEQMIRYNYPLNSPTDIDYMDEQAKNSRWHRLISGLQFNEDVYKYYTHLRPSRDYYAVQTYNRCYVCNNLQTLPEESNTWNTIDVPVTNSTRLSGGKVWICFECELKLTDIDLVYDMLIKTRNLVKHKCCSCEQYYYVDSLEHEVRVARNQGRAIKVEWLCPECTYNQIDILEPGDFLYLAENDAEVQERFVPMLRDKQLDECYGCELNFFMDLSISRDYLYIIHSIHDQIICEGCNTAGKKSFLLDPYVYKFIDKIFIQLKHGDRVNVDDYWDYTVVKFARGKHECEILFLGVTEESEGDEAIAIAMDEIYTKLYGDQQELWDKKDLLASEGLWEHQ